MEIKTERPGEKTEWMNAFRIPSINLFLFISNIVENCVKNP